MKLAKRLSKREKEHVCTGENVFYSKSKNSQILVFIL